MWLSVEVDPNREAGLPVLPAILEQAGGLPRIGTEALRFRGSSNPNLAVFCVEISKVVFLLLR